MCINQDEDKGAYNVYFLEKSLFENVCFLHKLGMFARSEKKSYGILHGIGGKYMIFIPINIKRMKKLAL